ncbi:hypothetical protein [Dyadobacter sp. CY323]|uniref:hypothetical protein n=1 Tax=Dyadobacter sp. CY323 TaxID=2907302 RepID=UPI001F29DB1B|nr:hypothetical protein [Dyadobacter sp. CY323]MCE6987852.1 hypothetical protein [Dyadobacter sp. CY323]
MTVKLKKEEFDYLSNSLLTENEDLYSKLQFSARGSFFFVEVSKEIVDEVHEWAMDELQRIGFDINYDLTKEGKILQGLVDTLFEG